MIDETPRKLYLTPTQTKVLFGYYFVTLLAAFFCACAVFVPGPLSRFEYLELAFIGSASMASLGSSVFYIRKLYKAVLSDALTTDNAKGNLKASATFVNRPGFSGGSNL